MSTEKITVPSGGWWEIKTIVTRGMRKAMNKAAMQAVLKLKGDAELDITDAEALKQAAMAHPDLWDMTAEEDAMLLVGTVAWSFEAALSLDTIDSMDDRDTAAVIKRMRELYQAPSEEASKNLPSTPSTS